MMLTKREEYIKKTFFSDLEDERANEIVSSISEIGNAIGFIGDNVNQNDERAEKRKHKYDVWISKEVKKSFDGVEYPLIKRVTDFRLIVDWASETNADIFRYDFYDAYEEQAEWHHEMRRKWKIENMDIPKLDEERIIFKFSDQEHFLYLLTPKELTLEGNLMGHCVGGKGYKSRVKNKQSLILSLRDKSNLPHVTIEIDVKSNNLVQKFGKSNKPPVAKYNEMLFEFVLFSTKFKKLRNKEVLKFLNINFITKT